MRFVSHEAEAGPVFSAFSWAHVFGGLREDSTWIIQKQPPAINIHPTGRTGRGLARTSSKREIERAQHTLPGG